MKTDFHKKYFYNPNELLIDHNIIDYSYHYEICLFNKNQKDENEQKLFDLIPDKKKLKIKQYNDEKEFFNCSSSKHNVMDKVDLDDKRCLEGKIETKKIEINKKMFPKSMHSKDKKDNISPKKKTNKKKHSKQKSKNKSKIKKIKELNQFFSSKTLLISILNEMEEK